jgi:hypothetical protein
LGDEMNLKCDSIDGINPVEPAKDIRNQTYMVMNPTRERSKDQDVWLDIINEVNSQQSFGPDSDGSVSTYSFSRNPMTSLSNQMRRNMFMNSSYEHQRKQKKDGFCPLWAVPLCVFTLSALIIAGKEMFLFFFSNFSSFIL